MKTCNTGWWVWFYVPCQGSILGLLLFLMNKNPTIFLFPFQQTRARAGDLWPVDRPEGMPVIQSLEVMCGKDHMDVHLTFSHPFEGIVSSKGKFVNFFYYKVMIWLWSNLLKISSSLLNFFVVFNYLLLYIIYEITYILLSH